MGGPRATDAPPRRPRSSRSGASSGRSPAGCRSRCRFCRGRAVARRGPGRSSTAPCGRPDGRLGPRRRPRARGGAGACPGGRARPSGPARSRRRSCRCTRPTGYRDRRMAEVDRAAATGHVPPGLLGRWERGLEEAGAWRFTPCVVHGDLAAENVLVTGSGDGGRITGVLGWGQVRVADPADDLAWLVAGASPAALESVLEAYAPHAPGGARPRPAAPGPARRRAGRRPLAAARDDDGRRGRRRGRRRHARRARGGGRRGRLVGGRRWWQAPPRARGPRMAAWAGAPRNLQPAVRPLAARRPRRRRRAGRRRAGAGRRRPGAAGGRPAPGALRRVDQAAVAASAMGAVDHRFVRLVAGTPGLPGWSHGDHRADHRGPPTAPAPPTTASPC